MASNPLEIQYLFCPRPSCVNHRRSEPGLLPKSTIDTWFIKRGRYRGPLQPDTRQRFQCRNCRKTFSETLSSLEYRIQRRGYFEKVFELFKDGLSNRQIGRFVGLSESVVRNRLDVLSRQAFFQHQQRSMMQPINEAISYDGVENFARSQYEPNYVNQAIGMKSGFIYDFNFAPLNRKGRMSDRQRLKNAELQTRLGRFPRDAVRHATTSVLSRLCLRVPSNAKLELCSDEHFQYRPAVRIDLKEFQIQHMTISAKAPRTFRHILFQVNHTDLLLRQHVKAFARETISFSKTHAAMLKKYALFMAWKNYMRPQFVKRHKLNPKSNNQTPAMAAGFESRLLSFDEFFSVRLCQSQIELNSDWTNILSGSISFPRSKLA